MQRKPNPRTLAAAFLLASAALSVLVLARRNLYDDEIFSLHLVTGSVANILRTAAEGDVHPPGMYLLAHCAYRILPSFRWMDLFPALVLYAGLAVFLFAVTPLLQRTRSQLCLLLLATLHPQLLMWDTTFRWYSWWTGLALIALTVALQPRIARPTLSAARALTLGLLLACLFYLNYIVFLFAVALAAAMFLRYRTLPWKLALTRCLLTLGVFFLFVAPQLRTLLTVHLPDGRAQRYGFAVSLLRLLQSVAVSEAYLPWHPLAILAGLVFAGLCAAGAIALWRRAHNPQPEPTPPASVLESIVLFGLLFFLLVAASGLGGKPRNGLLLIPVLALPAVLTVETLRPRTQTAILIFFALWSAVGIAHLLGRYGLTKSTMNDRPEQVVALVERGLASPAPRSQPPCAVVVTYDSGLAFALAQANLARLLIVSPYRGPGGARTLPPEDCARPRLYTVQSYLGGTARRVQTLNGELEIAQLYIEGPPSIDSFSFDPDARLKRRLARVPGLGADLGSVASLPDYRYVVTSGPIDRAAVQAMRRRMTHFVSGYETGVD